jgi:hypothetical protein
LKGVTKCPQDENEGSCMLSNEKNRLQLRLKRHDKGSEPRECIETHFQDCEKK